MKIVVYLCSLLLAIVGIGLALEFGLEKFLPDVYRGYLIEDNAGNVKWAIGPFEPSEKALGFNRPIKLDKPDDTIRIIALGASGTEGWLSAKTVFNKYGQTWEPKKLSSYSRVIEFSMNEIASTSTKKVEVINLGVAAYNITDVIRMLKDSLKLDPDLFVIQIGGNETWTAERSSWSSFISEDIPYLYTELAYEIFSASQAGWKTLSTGGNAFNPLALFSSGPEPIMLEPPGRSAGLVPRLENYRSELQRLGKFLQDRKIPALFMLPSQNLADFSPFGSMAKTGTSPQELQRLNELLVAARAAPADEAKSRFAKILELDDGIAEANYQLGKIYLQERNTEKAREHFWKANDRDVVLKRLPSAFHKISHEFIDQNRYPYLDAMEFFDSRSEAGMVGYNWLDDDVHPSRKGQFELGKELVKLIIKEDLLAGTGYEGSLQELPTFSEYNDWAGFDQEAAGSIAYLKGAHNFLAFGRYKHRLRWDPKADEFLEPILADLSIANSYSPSDQSMSLSTVLNLFLGRRDIALEIVAGMGCRTSTERSAKVNSVVTAAAKGALGSTTPELTKELQSLLVSEGCIR